MTPQTQTDLAWERAVARKTSTGDGAAAAVVGWNAGGTCGPHVRESEVGTGERVAHPRSGRCKSTGQPQLGHAEHDPHVRRKAGTP